MNTRVTTQKPRKESGSEKQSEVLSLKALISKAYKDLPQQDLQDENPVSFRHLPKGK